MKPLVTRALLPLGLLPLLAAGCGNSPESSATAATPPSSKGGQTLQLTPIRASI